MFAVIYRFKVKKDHENKFEKSWEAMTYEFRNVHGGLGSCLHKSENGEYVAYARWPNRLTWERKKEIRNTKAMASMKNSIEKSYPAIPIDVCNDLLFNN